MDSPHQAYEVGIAEAEEETKAVSGHLTRLWDQEVAESGLKSRPPDLRAAPAPNPASLRFLGLGLPDKIQDAHFSLSFR